MTVAARMKAVNGEGVRASCAIVPGMIRRKEPFTGRYPMSPRTKRSALRAVPMGTGISTPARDWPPATVPDPRLECTECRKKAYRILLLLRLPKAPNERRVCDDCLSKLVAAGMTSVSVQHSQQRCEECHQVSDPVHIASTTGEPVEIRCCDDCAGPRKAEGWRAAAVFGTC